MFAGILFARSAPEKNAFLTVMDIIEAGWQLLWLDCKTGLKNTSFEWRMVYVKR